MTAADERGNAFGVVLFQIVRTSELNNGVGRSLSVIPANLKDLIGIGNNFYARKLCLRIKLPFMREWVRKRHMTDFEMNVHRERVALAQKIIFYANSKSVAFGTSRRVSPRGSTGKGSVAKSLESRSALCRLICGNRH